MRVYRKIFEFGCGATDERSLVLIAGIHGNETSAVYLLSKYVEKFSNITKDQMQKICPNISSITFIVGPNVTGLEYNEREWVDDTKDKETNDLNRCFNTVENTEKDYVLSSIKDDIRSSDIVIDIHNSPRIMNCFTVDYDEDVDYFVDFLKSNKLNYVIRQTSMNPTVKKYANFLGKIGLTLELNSMGSSDNPANIIDDECLMNKLLSIIGDIPSKEKYEEMLIRKSRSPMNITDKDCSFDINAKHKGLHDYPTFIVFTKTPACKHYNKDENICNILGIKGELIEKVMAPCDGNLISAQESYILYGGNIGMFQPDI